MGNTTLQKICLHKMRDSGKCIYCGLIIEKSKELTKEEFDKKWGKMYPKDMTPQQMIELKEDMRRVTNDITRSKQKD